MKVDRGTLESIVAHARESLPRECCGILLAQAGDSSTITLALRAENTAKDHPGQEYVLGHEAHLKAVEMESSGPVRIMGYYHSHPQGGNWPSRRDKMQAIAGLAYLIVGMGDGPVEHAAWRFEGDCFTPEPLEVSE